VRRSGGASATDPATRVAARRERIEERSRDGPGLAPAALAAAELSCSWLFSALQGSRASALPRLLATLVGTPDAGRVGTGAMLDQVLGAAGAQLVGSGDAAAHASADFAAGLPPALAAIVRASAVPLLDPRQARTTRERARARALPFLRLSYPSSLPSPTPSLPPSLPHNAPRPRPRPRS
jgi:hypothetical protein